MPDLAMANRSKSRAPRRNLHPEEHGRRLFVHLPGVAEPVDRDRAADLQAPAQVCAATQAEARPASAVGAAAEAGEDDGAAKTTATGPPLLLAQTWTTTSTSPAGG